MKRLSWSKNEKVERTSPGSKNTYKVTYWGGKEKWTDDYPGDGRPGRYQDRKNRRKQSRPSIKDAKGTLGVAVKKYEDGGEKGVIFQAVDDVIVHVGREVARETIRKYIKSEKEGAAGRKEEALGLMRDRMLEKLRKKTAMGRIARRVRVSILADRVLAGWVRERIGYEFPSQGVLDAYLKAHPKADKSRHWVRGKKPQKNSQKPDEKESVKTEEKTVKKFKVPEHKKVGYEVEGDLGDVGKWKAKIVLGNSARGDQKKGQMDEVGYVGINPDTDEIVPIARSDEHRAGHELLDHLNRVGVIRGRSEDYNTLYSGNNYPHYETRDTGRYARACRKWLDYGGKNYVVHSQNQSGGKNPNFITDMEEYAELGGKLPYGQEGPSKPGREILDHMEGAVKSLASGDSKAAFDHADKMIERMNTFDTYTTKDYDQESRNEFEEAKGEGDTDRLGKLVKKVAGNLHEALKSAKGDKYSYVPGMFGVGDEALKRVGKVAGSETGGSKGGEKVGLSEVGEKVVGHFEKAAKAATRKFGSNLEQMEGAALDLIEELEPMREDIDGLDSALAGLQRAVGSGDEEKIQQGLFSFNGVKNLVHQRLRKLEKDGVAKDKHFGDVKTALAEFERLGQI